MSSSVLVVTTTFPQGPDDPRGAFIHRHWELQAQAGSRVRVLAPRNRGASFTLPGPLEICRVAYAPGPLASLAGNFGILENIRAAPWRALLVPALWSRLQVAVRRELETGAWSRVVAHMLLPAGFIVAKECARRGVPFELFGHGTDVDLFLRLPGRVRAGFLRDAKKAEAISFPSEEKLRRFREVLGPAVDPAPLRVEPMVHCVTAPQDVPQRPRAREILYLGRLIPQKGVDDLLRAVARMPSRPLARPLVHIAGDGPQRRQLERLARQLGLVARFHGFVAGAAKEALLGEAGVLCVPSREVGGWLSEGAPLVIREALVRGLPVVATSVGGIVELAGDAADVRLVPPGQPDALANALSQALRGTEPETTQRACSTSR